MTQPYEVETGLSQNAPGALEPVEVAPRQGPAAPVSTVEDADAQKEAVMEAIADALGEAYDCTRVWAAWSHGTMGPDDFALVAEDSDRLAELADAAIAVMCPAPAAGDARKPNLDIEAAAKTLAECMDYPWAHMPEQGRTAMRQHAQTVIDAAIAAQQSKGGAA